MFSVNDTVQYGRHGVCKVAGIAEKELFGKTTEYYELRPVYDENSTIYVPIDSEKLLAKIRRVLSVQEIHDLVQSMPSEESLWVENENERRERYKEILTKGDPCELIGLVKAVYQHQQNLSEIGKKLHVSDQRFMNDAEKLLYEEFAHVLNIKREQVLEFIFEEIEVKA